MAGQAAVIVMGKRADDVQQAVRAVQSARVNKSLVPTRARKLLVVLAITRQPIRAFTVMETHAADAQTIVLLVDMMQSLRAMPTRATQCAAAVIAAAVIAAAHFTAAGGDFLCACGRWKHGAVLTYIAQAAQQVTGRCTSVRASSHP